MIKKIVFGAAHTPEFMDKWFADEENAKVVNDLIESGALDAAPRPPKTTNVAGTKKRSNSVRRAAPKRAAHAQ